MTNTVRDFFAMGDWNATCDRCCGKFKASRLKRDWQGFMLCNKCWEPRHPQDFVRAAPPVQPLPFVRPPCPVPLVYCAPMEEPASPPPPAAAEEANIRGRVWSDLDSDGLQDGGELGLGGVLIQLFDGDDALVASTTTDGSGMYSFWVPPGTYVVEADSTGYAVSPQDVGSNDAIDCDVGADGRSPDLVLADGGEAIVDIGLMPEPPPLASVSGFAWIDFDEDGQLVIAETGLFDLAVTLKTAAGTTVATTSTDYSGAYAFSSVVAGDYKIAFTNPEGYTPTTQNIGAEATDSDIDVTGETAVFTLTPGQVLTGVNAGYVAEPPPVLLPVGIVDFEHDFSYYLAEYGLQVTVTGAMIPWNTMSDCLDPAGITSIDSDTPANARRVFETGVITITVVDPDETPYNRIELMYLGGLRVTAIGVNGSPDTYDYLIDGPAACAGLQRNTSPDIRGLWSDPRIKTVVIQQNFFWFGAPFGFLVDDIKLFTEPPL